MSIAIISATENPQDWVEAIHNVDSSLKVEVYPHFENPDKVEAALLWHHPYGSLSQFKNLKWVTSLGAGVDHVISDDSIGQHIRITRIVDEYLSDDMANTALLAVMAYQHNLAHYYNQKVNSVWKKHNVKDNLSIGILGFGMLGKHVAKKLLANDYKVYGFSNSPVEFEGVNVYSNKENQLNDFLKNINVLINILPLTQETNNYINSNFLKLLNKGTYLINIARGGHINEDDLIEALDNNIISGAYLDVFKKEPLPINHPFWKHNKITITPHVASVTRPHSAAKLIVENFNRLLNGQELLYEINREKGY